MTRRDIDEVARRDRGEGRGAPQTRVIYTESHDEVANGAVRVPESIAPGEADNWWAKKRSVLGSVIVMTSPGIPMLFQGQELLEDRWFDDTVALDWDKAQLEPRHPAAPPRRDRAPAGERRVDARAARNRTCTILRADSDEGVGDAPLDGGRPARRHGGRRELREPDGRRRADRVPGARAAGASASTRTRRRYDLGFDGHEAFDLDADGEPMDGCDQSGLVSLGPYSLVIFSRED